LDQLQQARAVGIDFVLSDINPAYPQDDQALAQAMVRHGRVVVPQIVDASGHGTIDPLPPVARAAAGLGYVNIYPDQDGVIRSISLYQALDDGTLAQHFIMAMLDVAGDEAS